jgi:tryptophan-rich sensory protein
VWLAIGAVYYVICFVILYRLFASGFPSLSHQAALVLLLMLMVANAAWGFLFFRRRDLRASFLAFLPYGLLAFAFVVVLARIDSTCVVLFAPYLAYLAYATWWAHSLLLLNRS